MPYLLDHAARLCLLAAFLWLSGHAIRRSGLSRWDPGPLRPLADFCLGAVAWMVALFGLACVGLLASWNVILLGGCATLLAFRVRRRSGVEPPALGAEDAVITLTVMVVTSPLLLLALSPEVRWDAGTYHLLLPRRYLDAGGFVPVPMNVYSNWPLGTELLFTAAMQLGDHSVAKAVH